MARRFGQLAGVEHMVIEVCALDNEFAAANGQRGVIIASAQYLPRFLIKHGFME